MHKETPRGQAFCQHKLYQLQNSISVYWLWRISQSTTKAWMLHIYNETMTKKILICFLTLWITQYRKITISSSALATSSSKHLYVRLVIACLSVCLSHQPTAGKRLCCFYRTISECSSGQHLTLQSDRQGEYTQFYHSAKLISKCFTKTHKWAAVLTFLCT